jgi:hypothetical protein
MMSASLRELRRAKLAAMANKAHPVKAGPIRRWLAWFRARHADMSGYPRWSW